MEKTILVFLILMVVSLGANKALAKTHKVDSTSVQSIEALMALVTDAPNVTVTDSLRGGSFSFASTGPADHGIIFPKSNGGYWKRETDSVAFSRWYADANASDSSIIQRVINSKKKYIYINEGIYLVADIIIKNSNTNIIGIGSVMFKKSADNRSNHAILRIQNNADTIRNVVVDGIYIQFSPYNNTGTDKLYCLIMGNDSKYSENITMRHCTFDSSGNGFRSLVTIGGNSNMILDSCVFKNSFGPAISITSVLLDSLAITNCLFTNWACLGGAYNQYSCIGGNGGIFNRFYISNNNFINVFGNKFALELTGKNYGARFINNNFYGNGKSANGISGPFWADCVFSGNTLASGDGSHRSGFELVGYNCTIDSNVIENGSIIISGDSTLQYARADEKSRMGCGFLISRNTLFSSVACWHSQSIAIGSNNGRICNVDVRDNMIKNYALGNSQSIGFNGQSDIDSVIVRNNVLEDSAHLTSIRFYPNTGNPNRNVSNFRMYNNLIVVYDNPTYSTIENCAIRFDTNIGFIDFYIYDNTYIGYEKITNNATVNFAEVSGNHSEASYNLNLKKNKK